MKKKYRKVMGLAILVALAAVVPAAAETGGMETSEIATSDWIIEPKGQYISSSHAGISNRGSGVIGISPTTTAHEPVDKIQISLYLDRLEGGSWNQKDDYHFVFLPSDMPNGELTTATLSFTVTDQPAGYYYRVRGAHGVWKGSVIETQDTYSDGVYISSDPVYRSADETE